MHISYFTEQPYSALDSQDAWKIHDFDHPSRQPGHNVLMHSNRFFDPAVATKLFELRMKEYELADEVGFDGVMMNEHHNAAYCMQSRIGIMSAAVAARTKRVKIVQLGNPLPTAENPVQIAEDIAMVDMMSGGRLVPGMVRAGGAEQIANNVNPAFNRERFIEAHDLIIKTWTVPGPWRWEGEHYQQRVVNPWALPVQKPHPRIWVPGVTSNETIEFAARRRYPFICLNTTVEDTKKIWERYEFYASQVGFKSGPQHRGYLVRCIVADTEEKARASAREHMWMGSEFAGFGREAWQLPTGYSSLAAKMGRRRLISEGFVSGDIDQQIARGTMVCGTPDQVIKRLRWWMEETRIGILVLWQNDGRYSHEAGMESIELMGRKVLPAVKEIAKELKLYDPFEVDEPVSLQFS